MTPYSTLDGLFNDNSDNSLWWIYRSAKIDCTKKPIWVYSSSLPFKVGGRNNYVRLLWWISDCAGNLRYAIKLGLSLQLTKTIGWLSMLENLSYICFLLSEFLLLHFGFSRYMYNLLINWFHILIHIKVSIFCRIRDKSYSTPLQN